MMNRSERIGLRSTASVIALILAVCLLASCGGAGKDQKASEAAQPSAEVKAETSSESQETIPAKPEAHSDDAKKTAPGASQASDIVIIYTSDIHAGVHDNLSMAQVAALKKDTEEKTPYSLLVDCGDLAQGSVISSISKGSALTELANALGYDYRILGNHEFDYMSEGAERYIEDSDAVFLNANISYTGEGKNCLEKTVPYAIETFGDTKVALIGATTPVTIHEVSPEYFKDKSGKLVYDFLNDPSGQKFYDCIQKNIDEVRAAGADYVVLLAHCGINDSDIPFRSTDIIENTSGLNVILDAHSHTVIPQAVYQDKDGNDVLLTATGTKLAYIGKLVITPSGDISTTLISQYPRFDEAMDSRITEVESFYENYVNEKIFTLDHTLSVSDTNGVRMVRNRETGIGNLVADAYRTILGTDISVINGGGVRADLEEGDISLGDIINVTPFGNLMCVIEVTGEDIINMLEEGAQMTESEYGKNGIAIGEYGSFFSVSGLKYTIDTSIPSSVVDDPEEDCFIEVDGPRRVKDVCVLTDGEYVPIDLEKTYTLGGINYILKNGGSGMGRLLADHNILVDETVPDYEVLIDYITNVLKGDLSDYYEPEGRITIE